MRLWIDTDIGDDPDDAVALLCAAAHPDVEIVGVSTSGGDTSRRVRTAREVVDAPVLERSEPDAIAASFTVAAPDAVLAIGPLTNIAGLLERGVLMPELTVMGGALGEVHHRGAVRAVEHNFGSDPHAAAVVLGDLQTVLVPLDTTVAIRLDAAETERLLHAAPALQRDIDAWIAAPRASSAESDDVALVLHDPLAFLVCMREARVSIEPRAVAVDASSGAVRDGVDGRVQNVVTRVDAPHAIARILSLLES